MKKLSILLVFFISSMSLMAQSDKYFGTPQISHIKPPEIKHNIQAWGIEANDPDYTYIATGYSIAIYNGHKWSTFSHPQHYFIRTLYYDPNSKRLYVAGDGFFGYLVRDNMGNFIYENLHNSKNSTGVDLFWRIYDRDGFIYFQTSNNIFAYTPLTGQIHTLSTSGRISFLHNLSDRLLVQIDSKFYQIYGTQLKEVGLECDYEVIFIDEHQDELIFFTTRNGVFTLNSNGDRRVWGDKVVQDYMSKNYISCGTKLKKGGYAVGSSTDGFAIINNDGTFRIAYNEIDGLPYTTAMSIAEDNNSVLWIGFDGIISKLDQNDATSALISYNKKIGSVFNVCQSNGITYMATNKGVYMIDKKHNVELVAGSEGTAWQIYLIDNKIYTCHINGFLRIEDGKVVERLNETAWRLHQITNREGLYLLLDGNGAIVFQATPNGLKFRNRLENCTEKLNYILIDIYGAIWLNGFYGEVKRIKTDRDFRRVQVVQSYPINELKNEWIGMSMLDSRVLFFNDNNCYNYSIENDVIIENSYYSSLFATAGRTIGSITQYGEEFVYISGDYIGIIERHPNNKLIHKGLIFHSEEYKHIINHFRSISFDGSYASLGIENGAVYYNMVGNNENLHKELALDKLEYNIDGEVMYADISNLPHIEDFHPRAKDFSLSVRNLTHNDTYYISIDDSTWQCRSSEIKLEKLDFGVGSHTIRLRSTMESTPYEIKFRIAPRFTATGWFWALILLCLFLILLGVYLYYKIRIKVIHHKLERKKEDEILRAKIEYETEQLHSTIKEQSKQLTNFAMNRIHLNNLLGEIQGDIINIKSGDFTIQSQLRSVSKKITYFKQSDQDWKNFERYFNQVYDGFFDVLTQQHPNLTKGDLKIAAYIRLGLSSKEIASLMNVSSSSVDMARYRLRKNLGLAPEDSLTRFISSL